ncbi:MAG TPA: hypothetical protein VE170_16995 [Candidatus Limnocylindria bacterium]|nr:hypothetical protein [Candidatus Limnocylindria bacterium]
MQHKKEMTFQQNMSLFWALVRAGAVASAKTLSSDRLRAISSFETNEFYMEDYEADCRALANCYQSYSLAKYFGPTYDHGIGDRVEKACA